MDAAEYSSNQPFFKVLLSTKIEKGMMERGFPASSFDSVKRQKEMSPTRVPGLGGVSPCYSPEGEQFLQVTLSHISSLSKGTDDGRKGTW